MLPLYPLERKKKFREKHLFFSAPLTLVVISGFYFLSPFSHTNNEIALAPPEAIPMPPLSDWVDEKPTLDESNIPQKEGEPELSTLPPPPPPSMERMKKQGCVADGFLSGYGGDVNSSIALVNRSQCYYLHRALETWLRPPDFALARKIEKQVTKPNTVYGMFIAEAIDTRARYAYPAEQRDFNFSDMCRSGSKNYWGEHTCKPSLGKEEYRRYVQYIAEQAMDIGVQSFLFGEVFYQDAGDLTESMMPQVIQDMREYADFRGMKIVIGAQTNDIIDERYLRLFDYIEGGVGIGEDGGIENGPCFSRWWQKPGDWCWALLWHPDFSSRANNVFVHLDWSGKLGDDMSVFTRMDKPQRATILRNLYASFTARGTGFMMPLLATLYKDNGGCQGPKKRFYSASRKYSCQDEDVINSILSGKK
ncbi:MAG: hypothetical protein WAV46_00185 [Candidatus Moraniibacteriota bacterium]